MFDGEFLHPCDSHEEIKEFPCEVLVRTDVRLYSIEHIEEKVLWCKENHIHVAWFKPRLLQHDISRTFYFKNEKDAVFFKTVWC
jgi:hypothetical protein